MSKPRSPSDQARTDRRQALPPAPAVAPLPSPRRFSRGTVALVVAGAVLAVGACYYFARPAAPSEDLALCQRFMALKNARDAAANDLLGPAPLVPADPLTPEEADALHAEFFLHGDYEVADVRPEGPATGGPEARFVIALRGSVTSPRISQTGPDGVDVLNRSMLNPDIVVRVEGGTLRAVRPRLHHDAGEQRMSEDDARRLFQPAAAPPRRR